MGSYGLCSIWKGAALFVDVHGLSAFSKDEGVPGTRSRTNPFPASRMGPANIGPASQALPGSASSVVQKVKLARGKSGDDLIQSCARYQDAAETHRYNRRAPSIRYCLWYEAWVRGTWYVTWRANPCECLPCRAEHLRPQLLKTSQIPTRSLLCRTAPRRVCESDNFWHRDLSWGWGWVWGGFAAMMEPRLPSPPPSSPASRAPHPANVCSRPQQCIMWSITWPVRLILVGCVEVFSSELHCSNHGIDEPQDDRKAMLSQGTVVRRCWREHLGPGWWAFKSSWR
ncbi:hypothetical protein VTI74DRAFT_6042 [Chaetomium olivicolor]